MTGDDFTWVGMAERGRVALAFRLGGVTSCLGDRLDGVALQAERGWIELEVDVQNALSHSSYGV